MGSKEHGILFYNSHSISLISLLNFVCFPELIEGIVLTKNVDILEIKMTLLHETPSRSFIETHRVMSLTMQDMLNKRNHNSQRSQRTQYLMGTLHTNSETWRRPDSTNSFASRRWGSSVWHLTLKNKSLSP